MNNAITFYKLTSPYTEDKTKNCGLVGSEVDANFMSLKEYDIKEAYFETALTESGDTKLYLTFKRVGSGTGADDEISIDLAPIFDEIPSVDLSGYTRNLTVGYDIEKGILTLSYNGETHLISGLATIYTDKPVYSDQTLDGNGLPQNPLKLSRVYKTGQYSPCLSFIDETNNDNTLPSSGMVIGDRYLTKEIVSPFGKLYKYETVQKIKSFLEANSSPWRIPTKYDWDIILDAAEDCEQYQNHTSPMASQLGHVAGKKLKSRDYWIASSGSTVLNTAESCGDTAITLSMDPTGIDTYGFRVLPAGEADNYPSKPDNFLSQGAFWTDTINSGLSAAYIKKFTNDNASVTQEAYLTAGSPSQYFSIRLVRDMSSGDVSPVEEIAGVNYPIVVMPTYDVTTKIYGTSVWTTYNLDGFGNFLPAPLIPNNGDLSGLTTISYCINEWNGTDWQRIQMKEGDSVVLLKGLSGETDNEYRAVSGASGMELVNVADIESEKVIEILSATVLHDMDERISANTVNIQYLSGAIDSEVSARTSADTYLQQEIDSVSAIIDTVSAVAYETSAKLDTETAERISADTVLQSEIDATNSALTQEISDRKDADAYMSGIIDSVSAKVDTVSGKLDDEISERTDADKVLSAAIDDNTAHVITAGTFDCSGGTLTLFTKDSKNNVEMGLTSNYGEYESYWK